MKTVGFILLAVELLTIRSVATPLAKTLTSGVIEFALLKSPQGIRLERRANEDTLSQVLRGNVSIN